jgi:hypothetical protein
MRRRYVATGWLYRGRFTRLLRSGFEPFEARYAQCSSHTTAHRSGHISSPGRHGLRRPPARSCPSQRCSYENPAYNRNADAFAAADVVTLGCSGTYAYERWQIEQEAVSIIAPDGRVVASYPPPLLELKTDVNCSGISIFDEPFAQVGAFWLSRWGTSVFDGLNSTVWIPTDP